MDDWVKANGSHPLELEPGRERLEARKGMTPKEIGEIGGFLCFQFSINASH